MTLKEQTDLLGWKDITTSRQMKNGTIIYRLPIKKYGQFIEIGSFESGYVRRMNGCYTPYQLNKCEPNVEYYPEYEWKRGTQFKTGKYNKYVGKRRIKIMSTRKRVQYLIDYCLKNYYINQANMIEDGKFIPKWKHEYEMKNGSIDKVIELQQENNRLHNIYLKQTSEIQELQREITNWKNLADEWKDRFEESEKEIDKLNNEIVDSRDRGALDNLTVFVNNEKYKII